MACRKACRLIRQGLQGAQQAMIQELTPQLLMVAMLLVGIVVPIVASLLSALLIWRYRVAVERAMAATVGFARQKEESPLAVATSDAQLPAIDAGHRQSLERLLLMGPWYTVLHQLAGAAAFALVFAGAAHVVYPHNLGSAGFLLAVWIYIWPYFLALPLLVDMQWQQRLASFGLYFGVYIMLGVWAGTIFDVPGYRFGAVDIPPRSSVTPEGMLRLWLAVNAVPSVLVLVSLYRRFRAVAPLVLALVTAAVSGLLGVYFAVFSEAGTQVIVSASAAMDLHVYWLLLAILLVALSLFIGLGWLAMTWIAAAYRHRRLSDQSLLIDVLWLLFASIYTMWLVISDAAWLAILPAAMLAHKIGTLIVRRVTRSVSPAAVGLTFLRVFSLGRRSEALFDIVARHWRHVGSVQLITGPDLAQSTVQPHQFLDFLSGRLRSHFVNDQVSMQHSLVERDLGVDPDRRFRVNCFFCHADSWQAVLPQLVGGGDIVLMDLRSYSPGNAGCTYELEFLVSHVPFRRCLLLSDQTTDEGLVDETLERSVHACPQASPNFGRPISELKRFRSTSGRVEARSLLRYLCKNACPSVADKSTQ